MPIGERAFAESKGPRSKVTLLISQEAYLLLKLVGAIEGTSATGKGVSVIEEWAEELLEREHEHLAEVVAGERRRREREHAKGGSR